MQTIETHQQTPSKLFLDDIYVPSLSAASAPSLKEVVKTQKHAVDVNELHRFLESNCDCV